MDGACSTYGREERCIRFWWGNLRERDHLGDAGVRSWEDNIKLDLQEVRCEGHGLD